MPGLQDLLAAIQSGGQPGSPQGAPPPAGNPLAALAQQPQAAPQPPILNHAQTVAAVHHFGQIKQAMLPVMDDPNLGKTNIRPKLLDAMSKLLASKALSLPEIMKAVKSLPEDPMAQKGFVDKIYTDNDKAQKMVLQNHAMGQFGDGEPEPWTQDGHGNHMAELAKQYGIKP